MLVQVVDHLGICVDHGRDLLGIDIVFQPNRRDGGHSFDLELVAVQQEPHKGLGVIRLIGDIREDEDARPGVIGQQGGAVDRRGSVCHQGTETGEQPQGELSHDGDDTESCELSDQPRMAELERFLIGGCGDEVEGVFGWVVGCWE